MGVTVTPEALSNQMTNALITIDNAGIIPIINNSPTTSVIYVHNNSNIDVGNISYQTSNNTGGNENSLLDPLSTTTCRIIKAGQSCPLKFTTPVIDTTTAQGSSIISLSYSIAGYNGNQINNFNRIISYSRIPNISSNGAMFNSGVSLTSTGNNTAYATLYMYGSGHNQNYTVENMVSDKSNVTITQGNLTDEQIQSSVTSYRSKCASS